MQINAASKALGGLLAALGLVAAGGPPAIADVISSGANGFQLRQVVQSPLAPPAAYRRFVSLRSWWSAEHTYSGKASALSLDARPGGCWCEKLANGGGVRHMSVSYVDPGRTIVFEGGLGPLQQMGAGGAMTVSFKPGASGSEVTLIYNVSGFTPGGLAAIAPIVDQVLRAQLERFAAAR
jgi:hypothetical protein